MAENNFDARNEGAIEKTVTIPEALDISLDMLGNIEDNLTLMADDIAAQLDEIASLRDVILAIRAASEEDAD